MKVAGESQPNDYLISNHRESNICAGRGSVREDTHLALYAGDHVGSS